jgi:protoporphyrinogen oxidase
VTNIVKLIEQNDDKLKVREDKLIERINLAYEKAIKEAIKEFKHLEKIDQKPSRVQVANILKKTMNAFSEEMEKLVDPITKATIESYDEGLNETGQIVKASREE